MIEREGIVDHITGCDRTEEMYPKGHNEESVEEETCVCVCACACGMGGGESDVADLVCLMTQAFGSPVVPDVYT